MKVGFEVVTVKSSVFWGISLSSLVKVHQYFGGTYHLPLQGQRVRQARQHKVGTKQRLLQVHLFLSACFMLDYSLTLKMEVIPSSKMLDDFHQSAWHCMPGHITLCAYKTLRSVCVSVSVQYWSHDINSDSCKAYIAFFSWYTYQQQTVICTGNLVKKQKSHICKFIKCFNLEAEIGTQEHQQTCF